MRTEDLYQKKQDCCGCELCAQSCPQQIIRMQPDEEGFLYPLIQDESSCINCKRCIRLCPIKSPGREKSAIQKSFSYSMPEANDLKKSASGGLATAISRAFVKNGGIVYGVAYVESYNSISYVRVNSIEDLEKLRGSKYVQAIKGDIYKKVRNDLKDGKDVLYIGLPCEISALYHAIKNTEQLYTVSLICHGPTSQKVHRDYCKSLPNAKQSNLTFFSVRYKLKGWKPYYIHAEYTDGSEYNEKWTPSDYGMAFLFLKRPSCGVCRYKAEDKEFGLQADMIIGDFHGVDINSDQYNCWGVSQGSILTKKGEYLASLIGKDVLLNDIPYSLICKTNQGLFIPIPQRGNRKRFVNDYLIHSLHIASHSPMVKRANRHMAAKAKILRIIRGIKKLSKIMEKLLEIAKTK